MCLVTLRPPGSPQLKNERAKRKYKSQHVTAKPSEHVAHVAPTSLRWLSCGPARCSYAARNTTGAIRRNILITSSLRQHGATSLGPHLALLTAIQRLELGSNGMGDKGVHFLGTKPPGSFSLSLSLPVSLYASNVIAPTTKGPPRFTHFPTYQGGGGKSCCVCQTQQACRSLTRKNDSLTPD